MPGRKLGSGKFLVEVGGASMVVEGVPDDFEVTVSKLGRVVSEAVGRESRYPDLEGAIDAGRDLLLEDFERSFS